jgi:hypothetical protein
MRFVMKVLEKGNMGRKYRRLAFSLVAFMGEALMIAAPASANSYTLDFTDTHGDTASLTLTAGPLSLGGTSVTSITGLFNGLPVSEIVVFGADQRIYSFTVPLVDYAGLGFTNGTPYNLYWTNTAHTFAQGELGICYTANCNTTFGFYPLTFGTLDGVPLQGVTPLPSTWTMALLGLAGLGFFSYRRQRRPFNTYAGLRRSFLHC